MPRAQERSSSAHRAWLAIAACSMAFVACGTAAGSSKPTDRSNERNDPIANPISSSSQRDAQPTASGPIVSAWIAAQQAFEEAARSANPDEPELAATTIPPLLPWSESLLRRMRSAGQVGRGPVQLGRPQVVAQQDGEARVQSCVHDEEIVISAATGVPAPGDPGQVDFLWITSTMQLTSSGWKLATQTVEVGQCHAS